MFLWGNLATLMMVLLAGENSGNVGSSSYPFRSKQVDTGRVNRRVSVEAAGIPLTPDERSGFLRSSPYS
jgi:hypothetical protein